MIHREVPLIATIAPDRPDAAAGRPAPPPRLSSRGWARIRRSTTTAVFVIATVIAIAVGVRGVEVSPVAPALALSPPATSTVAMQPTVTADGPGRPEAGPRLDNGAGGPGGARSGNPGGGRP